MDPSTEREPIAVTGIGCRFPGSRGPAEFWQFLRDGKDAIKEVPPERWDLDAVYDPIPATPGRTVQRQGGYLDGLDLFDANFFGISRREAVKIDPQQRVLLEVSWEALEDAGLPAERLEGSRTGVFVGLHWNDHEVLRVGDLPNMDVHTLLGLSRSVVSGRVSYALGLQGASASVDAACASSMVSIHMALQSLWLGESDVTLACGINVILQPAYSVAFSQGEMLAPDGRCKAFSAEADGFVRSEGVGVVVLKRLSSALADGDRVYAVVRGSSVNNDGRASGAMSTPAMAGQEEVLREAYRTAGVAPHQVHYVEAHGTGTAIGDPVEATALAAVLGEGRPSDRPLTIGSVKTNIGHTEGAAGIAGFIKAALALHHREVPPSLHSENLNPAIPWDDIPVEVQRHLEPWPEDRPLLAGVSSFGISGTNAHIVLEGAPEAAGGAREDQDHEDRLVLLPVSARSPEALRASAAALSEALRPPSGLDGLDLADVCRTNTVHHTHHDHRLVVTGTSAATVAKQLSEFAATGTAPAGLTGRRRRAGKKVFVFAGHGAQWQGMCAELMRTEPVFEAAIDECEEAMRPWVDWSLRAALAGELGDITDASIDVVQPSLFATQVALAALWRSWGIQPDAVVGHSMGEVAAAHVAGAISLADAARVICLTSRRKNEVSGRGGMLVVGLPQAETSDAIRGYAGRLSIATVNGPSTTVVAGDNDALEEAAAEISATGTFCQRVMIDAATHSSHMAPLRDGVLSDLEGIGVGAPVVPFHSTVPGGIGEGGLDAMYWFRNMREPVLLWPVFQNLCDGEHDTFIEISAHPVLLGALREAVAETNHIRLLPSIRRGQERETILASLGTLYTTGHHIDWRHVHPRGRRVNLPPYPWQYSSFPLSPPTDSGLGTASAPATRGHPLLAKRLTSAVHVGTAIWETNLRAFPLLADHQVQGVAVMPGAAYAEMALSAAAEMDPGPQRHEVMDMSFNRALPLTADRTVCLQVVLTHIGDEWSFQCFSDQREETAERPDWVLHAQGRVRRGSSPADTADALPNRAGAPAPWAAADFRQEHGPLVLESAEFYRRVGQRGLNYGTRFRLLDRVWCGGMDAWATLRETAVSGGARDPYLIGPALLDACFHALFGVFESRPELGARESGTALFLPVNLGALKVSGVPSDARVVHAEVRYADDENGVIEGDVTACDSAGRIVLEAVGLRMRRLAGPEDTPSGADRYRLRWTAVAAPEADATPTPRRYLLLDAGDRELGDALTARGDTCVRVRPGETFERIRGDLYTVPPDSPADFQRLLAEVTGDGGRPLDGVIAAWALRAPDTGAGPDVVTALPLICGSTLHLVQALAAVPAGRPRLWLVTQGAQAITPKDRPRIASASLWGLGRTVANEYPDLRCTLVDLDVGRAAAAELLGELSAEDEDEIAWRDGSRYAPRLVDASEDPEDADRDDDVAERRHLPAPPFRMETARPGMLDAIRPRPVSSSQPGPGEVEIEVDAAALNFKDIMRAMGMLPVTPPVRLGIECAGRISGVGAEVRGLRPGQRVVAVTDCSRGCVASHVIADSRAVVPIPDDLRAEDATTIPIVFLTAYYSLHTVGRIAPGDRVLIHAGTGGVGLAAIQLARNAGAEVFATAGSVEKRTYLRDVVGIEHVMDSRSTAFAEEVLALTGGRGVDIILNSLTGDAITAGLGALALGGRFIELGKRDINDNTHVGLLPFAKAISFAAIDLEALLLDQPALVGDMLRHLIDLTASGEITPLPRETFPGDAAGDAFRRLARAQHIGKVVISMEPAGPEGLSVRPDATYLITGGLGALGLGTARMLTERGARHLLLLGRRLPSPEAAEVISDLRQAGVTVTTVQADVGRREELSEALRNAESLPPLRGIIHAAGSLVDRTLERLTWEDFTTVLSPKVIGALNLHELTATSELDFFVMFSSVSALVGNPGQANYAAANAGMDAIAHDLRSQGRPALSINWGPWAQIGMAADATRGGRLDDMGLRSLSTADGLATLSQELAGDETQVSVGHIDAQQWARSHPRAAGSSLLRGLLARGESGPAAEHHDVSHLATLLAAEPPERRRSLTDLVSRRIATITRNDVASVRPDDRIISLGVDSLMAVELRHALETDISVSMPTMLMLQGSTVEELVTYLLDRLVEKPTEDTPRGEPETGAPGLPAPAVLNA